jgi:hypothetical protein
LSLSERRLSISRYPVSYSSRSRRNASLPAWHS